MSHGIHEQQGEVEPIFYDGCEECEERADGIPKTLYSLDHPNGERLIRLADQARSGQRVEAGSLADRRAADGLAFAITFLQLHGRT